MQRCIVRLHGTLDGKRHICNVNFYCFVRMQRVLAVGALLWGMTAHAQSLQVTVESGASSHVVASRGDTVALIFHNMGPDAVPISLVTAPSNTAQFINVPSVILPGATDTAWMVRRPVHNIAHQFPVWILTRRHGILSVMHQFQGVYADSAYYKPTRNLWDGALKAKLKQIITANHTVLSYSAARDKMFMIIDNWRVNGRGSSVNKVECVYTGRVVTGYSSRYDVQNQGFNTEHTFPQSKFGGGEPMRSDLFHLFPTDANANSARSNLPFGEVTTPTWSVGGSKKDYNRFEPRDAQKGPAARALFYFVVRYRDYSGFVAPQEATLRAWHKAFPPTAVEKRRNNDIYAIQHNRNPFIDHPEFVDRIYSITGSATRPSTVRLTLPADTLFISPPLAVDTFWVPFWVEGGMVNVTSVSYDTHYFSVTPPPAPVPHHTEGRIGIVLKDSATSPLTSPITLYWGNNRQSTFYLALRQSIASGAAQNPALEECRGVRMGSKGVYVVPGISIRRLQFLSVHGQEYGRIHRPPAGHWVRYPRRTSEPLIIRWIENRRVCSRRVAFRR